ncbi:MAG: hypothetical protein AB1705_12995 [Verrucomicrobiota bacterium]
MDSKLREDVNRLCVAVEETMVKDIQANLAACTCNQHAFKEALRELLLMHRKAVIAITAMKVIQHSVAEIKAGRAKAEQTAHAE